MALTTVRIGRYKTASEADYGEIVSGQMRACVFDAASQNFWATKIGGWFGKSSGTNATARLAAYETDGVNLATTDDRVGYTDAVTVSTSMTGPGGGAAYEPDVAVADNAPSNDAFMVYSGRRYAVAILGTAAGIGHSMIAAGSISADNEQFYNRTGLSQPPPDPFGAYSNSVEGHLTAWVEGYANEAPIAPNNRNPNGTINETAPDFECTFRDLNGAYGTSSGDGVDTGDQVGQYQIQLRAVGTTSLLWNTTYTATSAEKSSDNISRAYGGSSLSRGTAYEWRIRTSDAFGAWGDWSSWLEFTPANLGYVTLDSDPTGKIEDNTPDFKGRWTHQSATGMTQAQVRLLSSAGTVLQTSSAFAKLVASSAAPGTLFTCTWADTGFTDLAWGTSYQYQIRGYDGSQWSDWSAARSFSTDAAPSVPASLSPVSGSIFTSYPLLAFAMSDTDDDTGTGLTATIRITKPDTSTVDATATYNSSTGLWEFQTTGTELTAYGTYSWKAIGYDGTLYSGESSSLGSGTFSSSNTFTYALGPTVTIDEPDSSDTLTTASFDVEWTTTGQVKYKVAIYDAGTSDAVYESNGGAWTVSAAGSHTVPSGYVRNGESYDVTVTVENSTPLEGSDTNTAILIDYTAPTAVANFQATPIKVGADPQESAIRLSWDQTSYTAPEFREYTVYRRADGGPDADEIILARLTSPSDVALVDYTPASDHEYTYGIRVVILTGLDEIESELVEASAEIALLSTVLTAVGNGGTYRANLTNVRDRSDDRVIDEAVYQPLGQDKPTTVRSRTRYYAAQLEAAIIDTDEATAAEHKANLEALDAQGGTICARYGDGTKRFVTLSDLKLTTEHGGWFSVAMRLREERYTEGVS